MVNLRMLQLMQRIVGFIAKYVYAAVSCFYLFTVGFLVARHRALLLTIAIHFGYEKLIRSTEILPSVDIPDMLPEPFPIHIREPIAVDGNVSLLELVVIANLIRLHQPRLLFEIGTFDGRTTLNMAANCPEGATVYTLDLPKDQVRSTTFPLAQREDAFIKSGITGSRYAGTDGAQKIVQVYGDSASFDFSPFLKTIDFVFIDGSHSYDYVLHDSWLALRLLRDGRGVILWHDYHTWDGVTKALHELYAQDREFQDLKLIQGTSLVCLIR